MVTMHQVSRSGETAGNFRVIVTKPMAKASCAIPANTSPACLSTALGSPAAPRHLGRVRKLMSGCEDVASASPNAPM